MGAWRSTRFNYIQISDTKPSTTLVAAMDSLTRLILELMAIQARSEYVGVGFPKNSIGRLSPRLHSDRVDGTAVTSIELMRTESNYMETYWISSIITGHIGVAHCKAQGSCISGFDGNIFQGKVRQISD